MGDNSGQNRRALPGSERRAAAGYRRTGDVDPAAEIEVTVVLRRQAEGEIGASRDDLDTVTNALTTAGLRIVSSDAASRRIRVRGTTARLSDFFGAELEQAESRAPDGRMVTHRHRTGTLSVPDDLADRIVAVLGLDDRPQARAQFRYADAEQRAGHRTAEHAAAPNATATVSYTPLQLGTAYAFPDGTDGTGQHVGIIELGGGYATTDLDAYWQELGIDGPTVTSKGVDGAKNGGGKDPQGADGEVLLDIEVVGALAPKAAITVWFAPNSDDGFVDAVSDAIHASPTPAAVSISWGGSEDSWTAQARTAMDEAFADAVTLGVVVTVAAGDNGSSDGATDGKNHVDFPAASPHVLACGGTSLHTTATGTIQSETVWNDGVQGGATGGGISDTFARPSWQSAAGVPSSGRGVPDVAGVADPRTGYRVRIDGSDTVIGGTSAVAPLWAALVARMAQKRGALLTGFLETLYSGAAEGSTTPGFHDITTGSNGSYDAGPGWDACTGLGTPDGTAVLERLAGAGSAGATRAG